MYLDNSIYLGLSEGERVTMALGMANRHGLIAGASGTGKTVTMKVLAESFSDAGVPVFLCDIKGDVSGLAEPGKQSEGMEKRIDKFGLREVFSYRAYPVAFWDVYQEAGHPVRASVSDMGPELLSRILELTPAQEGVLKIGMPLRIGDQEGQIAVFYRSSEEDKAGGVLNDLSVLLLEGSYDVEVVTETTTPISFLLN